MPDLIQELKQEAEQVGYTLCTIDVKDILIGMRKKYENDPYYAPKPHELLVEISDAMDKAAALRKGTGMTLRQSDLG